MTEPSPSLLNKVRALLAKAESTSYPAEAQNLTAKATELMARYGVEQAMLDDAEPSHGKITNRIVSIETPYALDKSLLLAGVAEALGCRTVRRRREGDLQLHLFGFKTDLERAEILYTSLLVQSANALAAAQKPQGVATVTFRKSFLTVFTHTVVERLEVVEKRARDSVTGSDGRTTALVLADRSAAVDRAVAEQYPRLRRRTRQVSDVGAQAGRAAGQRADLDGKRFGGNRRAIGS